MRYWAICALTFVINLSFLIKPFTFPKSPNKNLNIIRTKIVLRCDKKHFSCFLKEFKLSEIVSDLRLSLQGYLFLTI